MRSLVNIRNGSHVKISEQMVEFLTFDQLDQFTKSLSASASGRIVANASQRAGKNVFLSHSSKDTSYLPAVITLLENHGGRVYVDVKDDELPKNPSVDTARILRENLRSCRKFMLLVTTNSKSSKWIPWELGLGDGEKHPKNVALIPAAQHVWDQSWAEQEYLGLYDRVIWGNFKGNTSPEWMVYDHHNNSGTRLREWIER